MAENFGDADDGKIFGVDDGVASGGPHAVSADAEEFEMVGWERLCGDSRPRLSGGAKLRGVWQTARCRASMSCAPYISPEASPAEIRIRKSALYEEAPNRWGARRSAAPREP